MGIVCRKLASTIGRNSVWRLSNCQTSASDRRNQRGRIHRATRTGEYIRRARGVAATGKSVQEDKTDVSRCLGIHLCTLFENTVVVATNSGNEDSALTQVFLEYVVHE